MGEFAFMRLMRRVRVGRLYLASSALMLCMLPMLLAGRSFSVFVTAYAVLRSVLGTADNAVRAGAGGQTGAL